jgi:putative endonuclease
VKTEKRKIGDIGEEIACKYLENKGYSVIERNYLKKWGEIDIVAKKDNLVLFVEVKTVSRESVRPEENMHSQKLARLQRAVQTYLVERKIKDNKECRIDLLCVHLNFETKKAKVDVFENVL